ncbi:hypothetical protein CXF82_18570 [Shewanella sp. GutDb-MelDb]|nr:hypothetical protein CXF82_18570 [Shewanella sp. GutDb-MelDb]
MDALFETSVDAAEVVENKANSVPDRIRHSIHPWRSDVFVEATRTCLRRASAVSAHAVVHSYLPHMDMGNVFMMSGTSLTM